MGQAGRPTSHYLLYPVLLCSTLRYPETVLCMSFSIQCRKVMHIMGVYPASYEERPTETLEPMRSTVPNTDQPRIPLSEHYYYSCIYRRKSLPTMYVQMCNACDIQSELLLRGTTSATLSIFFFFVPLISRPQQIFVFHFFSLSCFSI